MPTENYNLPFMGHKSPYLSSLLVTCHQSSRLYGVTMFACRLLFWILKLSYCKHEYLRCVSHQMTASRYYHVRHYHRVQHKRGFYDVDFKFRKIARHFSPRCHTCLRSLCVTSNNGNMRLYPSKVQLDIECCWHTCYSAVILQF